MINIDDKYIRIFEHFGEEEQTKKLEEETEELLDAIYDLNNGTGTVEDAEKELADVINVGIQHIIKKGGSPERVISQCTNKMIRTEKRVDSGYYE